MGPPVTQAQDILRHSCMLTQQELCTYNAHSQAGTLCQGSALGSCNGKPGMGQTLSAAVQGAAGASGVGPHHHTHLHPSRLSTG
jgi:hypothetical protein